MLNMHLTLKCLLLQYMVFRKTKKPFFKMCKVCQAQDRICIITRVMEFKAKKLYKHFLLLLHQYAAPSTSPLVLLFVFFLFVLGTPAACGNTQTRNRTYITAHSSDNTRSLTARPPGIPLLCCYIFSNDFFLKMIYNWPTLDTSVIPFL